MSKEKVVTLYQCIAIRKEEIDEDGDVIYGKQIPESDITKNIHSDEPFFTSSTAAIKYYLYDHHNEIKYEMGEPDCPYHGICISVSIPKDLYKTHRIKPTLYVGELSKQIVRFDNSQFITMDMCSYIADNRFDKIFGLNAAQRIWNRLRGK